MSEEKFNFDIHFQNGILKQMLQNDVFAVNCIRHLDPSYFENKYQAWLFKKIGMYVEKFKSIPSKHFLIDQLKTISEEELVSYRTSLKSILDTELRDVEYLKEELTSFIRNREYKKLHFNCAKLFNDGKFEDAYKLNEEKINEIRNTTFTDDSFVRPEDIDIILSRVSQEAVQKNIIPTGIPPIDKQLGGGLYKKTVSTIISAYNVGKTTSAINLGVNAALSGNKVLFVFHEGNKDRLVLKFISRITKIDYNSLIIGRLEESDKAKIEEAKIIIEKYIRIKEMRYVGVTVEDVFAYAKQTKKEWGLDMLIDDYGAILKSTSSKFKEKRHMLGHNWEMFNLMSAELDCAIVTIAQFNRDAVKDNRSGRKWLRSDDVAEAIDIAHHSENILTLNRSSSDSLSDEIVICLDKARDGQAGLLVKCKTDFRTMRIWDVKLGIYDNGWDDGKVRTEPKTNDQ